MFRGDATLHNPEDLFLAALSGCQARSGMPLNLIQQQLGHANISQTMRYARFNPDYGTTVGASTAWARAWGPLQGTNQGTEHTLEAE